ncbi:MAG: hypothetical protein O7F74_07220 [Bacteroidetes bacterium]|nr:hypothetical protein [Bacteroidota bacterium]
MNEINKNCLGDNKKHLEKLLSETHLPSIYILNIINSIFRDQKPLKGRGNVLTGLGIFAIAIL